MDPGIPPWSQPPSILDASRPPNDEVGVVLGSGAVLGRSDAAIVVLRSLTVYSTGFVIDVAMRLRSSDRRLDQAFFTRPGMAHDSFEIAIELPDGRRFATSVGPLDQERVDPDAGVALQRGNGNSWGREVSWWIWPLPHGDQVALVTHWPAYEITPTRTVLNASEIRDAARRSVRLFG